jgi:uncharacterized repeat protein (TIGR03809 family)
MPAGQGRPQFDDLARRWHQLADRRLANFTEMHRSGRWRHYYRTEAQFAARMLEVIKAAKIWAELAGREPPTAGVPVAAMQEASAPATVPARTELPSRAEVATAPKPHGLRPAA